MMATLEFLGGPIDGEKRRVPDGEHDYIIPIPTAHPLIEMHHGPVDAELVPRFVYVYEIGKKLVGLPGAIQPEAIPVMIYAGEKKR